MHQSLIAALNPGQYTAPDGANYWALLIPLAIVLVTVAIWAPVSDSSSRKRRAIAVGAFVVTVLTVVGAFAATTIIDAKADSVEADARTSYSNSVITWLDGDHGVTVNAKSVGDLLTGDSLVIDYQGSDTMIEIINRSDDDLAVRVTGGKLLQPLD